MKCHYSVVTGESSTVSGLTSPPTADTFTLFAGGWGWREKLCSKYLSGVIQCYPPPPSITQLQPMLHSEVVICWHAEFECREPHLYSKSSYCMDPICILLVCYCWGQPCTPICGVSVESCFCKLTDSPSYLNNGVAHDSISVVRGTRNLPSCSGISEANCHILITIIPRPFVLLKNFHQILKIENESFVPVWSINVAA